MFQQTKLPDLIIPYIHNDCLVYASLLLNLQTYKLVQNRTTMASQ